MYRGIFLLVITICLVGCITPVHTSVGTGDAAPIRKIDVATIPEIVPKPEQVVRAGNISPYTVLGKTYSILDTSRGYREVGYASWYGTKFHGRLTSNGEVYDMYQVTAAHKTLPIPAYVLVRNLDNGKELIVRVNDRGPFHDDRIIDLSWAAAAKLGFADTGVARVEVIALDPNNYQTTLAALAAERNPPRQASVVLPADRAHLQIGAFLSEQAARGLAQSVGRIVSVRVEVLAPRPGDSLYRVLAGPVANAGELASLQALLELNGLPKGYPVNIELFSGPN